MATPLQLAHVKDSRLRRLIDYWHGLKQDRSMPARKDIDPTEIPWALAHIWICDHVPEEGSFRYRLAGEKINEIFGRNIAKCLLQDITSADRFDETNRNFLSVIRQPAVLHRSGPLYLCRGRMLSGERLALPLSSDGRTADSILGATVAHDDPQKLDADLDWDHHQVTLTPLREDPSARKRFAHARPF